MSGDIKIIRPEWTGERITVRVEQDDVLLSLPRAKTARQLLAALNLYEETALVIRDGKLLTPDRRVYAGDELTVRIVASRG